MERLTLGATEVRVIDYEIGWRSKERDSRYSRRASFTNVSKIYDGAKVKLIRPAFLRIPLFDMASLTYTHALEIQRQIRHFAPDVIVGMGILNGFLGSEFARRSGIPFVYYLLDEPYTLIPYKVLGPFAKGLYRKVLQASNSVITITERLRDAAVAMGADPRRTFIIRTGVDPDRFSPNLTGGNIRKEYGLGRGDTALLYMGKIFHFSGIKEIALRLAEVRDTHPDLKLLVVGEARNREVEHDLENIVEKYGLSDSVIVTGKQPYERIPSFVAASDICLFPPYNNEVTRNIAPVKIYEYMMGGKPVISTRLPGIVTEFGSDNGISYVDSPEDVVPKAIKLSGNRSALEREGRKARRFAERYTWDKIVSEFESKLSEIVGVVQS